MVLHTSKIDPTDGAIGSIARPGTKNTASHFVKRVVAGVKYSKIESPSPGTIALETTRKANKSPHPASWAGNLMPACLK